MTAQLVRTSLAVLAYWSVVMTTTSCGYRFPHGYCRQRTGWICHLLATTFVADLDAAISDEQVRLYAQRVVEYSDRALASYPPGFSQIEPTVAMRRRAHDALGEG